MHSKFLKTDVNLEKIDGKIPKIDTNIAIIPFNLGNIGINLPDIDINTHKNEWISLGKEEIPLKNPFLLS